MTNDDPVTIIGSFNYIGPANLTNDEIIMVIGDLDEPDPDRRAGKLFSPNMRAMESLKLLLI